MVAFSGQPKSKLRSVQTQDELVDISSVDENQDQGVDEVELIPAMLEPSVFSPSIKALEGVSKKGEKAVERQKEKDMNQMVHVVQAIELLSPGVVSAMRFGGTPEVQSERFVSWMTSIKKKSLTWMESLELDSEEHPWVLASLERILAQNPFLKEFDDIGFLSPIATEHAISPETPWIPDAVSSPLALLEAVSLVHQAQSRFSLERKNPNQDLQKIAQIMVESAQEAVSELLDATASSDSRQVVFVTTLKQCGQIMNSLWMAYGEELSKKMGRGELEQERWHISHPNGASLDELIDRFLDATSRMFRLARMARFKSK